MSSQNWTVDVHGVEHEIRVDVDRESGKTFIRVDGRMAAPPLAISESERLISVAGATYVVRREGEGFEVDFDQEPEAWAGPAAAPAGGQGGVRDGEPIVTARRVVFIIAVIAGFAAAYWGYDTLSYWRVPWKAYTGPAARFRVSFPGDPAESTQDVAVANGRTLPATILSASYRKHEYDFFWFDLPAPITNQQADAVLAKALDGIVENEKGTLDSKEPDSYDGHSALLFTMRVPATSDQPAGAMRGRIILCQQQRVYCIFAVAPARQTLSIDVGEYLRSLTLAEDEGPRPADTPQRP